MTNMSLAPFLTSFFIILREGFEILLITTLIFTYIKKWNNALCEKGHDADTRAKQYVWFGIGSAVLASIAIALAFTYIKTLTHAHEELFEGVTMIVASAFLFYVAVWCHGAQQHVMGTVDEAITKGAALALAFTVFLAVVREGFEIVLFYAALFASSIAEVGSIAVGGAFGILALFVIYAVMNSAIAKMPTKLFFRVSSVLLIALAVYFAYNGGQELVEVLEH